jgi:hypothetical protein
MRQGRLARRAACHERGKLGARAKLSGGLERSDKNEDENINRPLSQL